ncbi:MAG TPA: AraC family transcriptional regulator [Thermoanaerobaculia bacterium]|jgi:AraC-like DNA-binding protein|nr:AraC family transcriptional regulator [Thermoanaerobaculia bacterium]
MTEARLANFARLVARHAPYDGTFDLRIAGTHATRVSHANTERSHAFQRSAVCIVAQGAKSVMIGDALHGYVAGQIAVYSVGVPVAAQVTRASAAEPYLNFRIDLDAEKVATLSSKVYPQGPCASRDNHALSIVTADAPMVDAASRFLELMTHPADAELLAPLVLDEILIRLLRSPMGSRIAQLGQSESSLNRIATSVYWLRTNFDQPVTIEELASRVHLSPSAFHRQFKAVTSMSPVQYQKTLRLQEARRLMLAEMMDAGEASRRVGYISASQFSREYGRFFGSAPTKDIVRLREQTGGGSAAN